MAKTASSGRSRFTWVVVTGLLGLAIIGTLCVPIYARFEPKLGDFPFFYWYQLLMVPVTAALCWICYMLLKARPSRAAGPRHGGDARR